MEGAARLIAAVAGAALLALSGSLVLLAWKPSERLRGYMLHMAAGLLLGVIAVELWPDLRELDRPAATLAGLAGGAAAMIALNLFTDRLAARHDRSTAAGLAIAAGIDSLVDGAVIGIGYAADSSMGLLLAAGIGLEKMTVTMAVTAEALNDDGGRRRALGMATMTVLPIVPAAAIGYLVIAGATDAVLAASLSAAAAALIYLVAIELVVRARAVRSTPGAVACLFAGFAALAAYALLGPG